MVSTPWYTFRPGSDASPLLDRARWPGGPSGLPEAVDPFEGWHPASPLEVALALELPPAHHTVQDDWSAWSVQEVVDRIVAHHHPYARTVIAALGCLVDALPRGPERAAGQQVLARYAETAIRHMGEEEDLLFPLFRRVEDDVDPLGPPLTDQHIHGNAGTHLVLLDHLEALWSWAVALRQQHPGDRVQGAVLRLLGDLRQDTRIHSELEDDVLVPMVLHLQELAAATRNRRTSTRLKAIPD